MIELMNTAVLTFARNDILAALVVLLINNTLFYQSGDQKRGNLSSFTQI